MKRGFLWLCFFWGMCLQAQETVQLQFIVIDSETKEAVANAFVSDSIQGVQTTKKGVASLQVSINSNFHFRIHHPLYVEKIVFVQVYTQDIQLGEIQLEQSPIQKLLEERLEIQLGVEQEVAETYLNANKDLLRNKAAFDWGSAFFKLRGLDNSQEAIYINGVPQNSLVDGRALWNQWGGLNDFTRSQTGSLFLQPSEWALGSHRGHTHIRISPFVQRPGLKTTFSSSNQSYQSRAMLGYTNKNTSHFQYSLGASFRGAKRGYKEGTPYQAVSGIVSVGKKWGSRWQTNVNAIYTQQERGKSAPLTQEVVDLLGVDYNPYWGLQNKKIRNSRIKKGAYRSLNISHEYQGEHTEWLMGAQFVNSIESQSRIAYDNAPNPDPIYYRNLPSYYVNSPIGANFYSAQDAIQSLENNDQIPWQQLYDANRNTPEGVSYMLLDDVAHTKRKDFSTHGSWDLNSHLQFGVFGAYRESTHDYFSKASDLLGGNYVVDRDPFSNTLNDIEGVLQKKEGERLGYHYQLELDKWNLNSNLIWTSRKWMFALGYGVATSEYQRIGLFRNERYPEESLGEQPPLKFNTQNVHLGFQYSFNPRNFIEINASRGSRAPLPLNSFINPREHKGVVPNLENGLWEAAEVNYIARWRQLQGKLSVFYTENTNETQIGYYFVHSGLGSAFIQEVQTKIGTVNKGVETSVSYNLSSSWNLSFVASIGSYIYLGNPDLDLYFDPNSDRGQTINTEGVAHLGSVQLHGLKSDKGPQSAFSLSLSYRSPKYWWASLSFNRLGNNYISLSKIKRTQSFYIDPDTGENLRDISESDKQAIFNQTALEPYYITNFLAGKSWLKEGRYTAFFLSVSNLLEVPFRSGGFEQSRLGNYSDYIQNNRSNQPSFGPKYWWSSGRRYYLNFTFSLP